MASKQDGEAVVIKKYPNRRLYNTETSVYVTLEDLADLVKAGRDFQVQDAKTGEDLTRQVLTQIIFEHENRGNAMLPVSFLRNIIRFYDDSMGGALQHYLEASMNTFTENQEKIRTFATKAMQDLPLSPLKPLTQFEEMARQNMALFEKAFSMFTPFGGMYGGEEKGKKK